MNKNKYIFLIMLALSLVVFLLSGCKDISDRYKPASFGKTAEENAMVKAITERYGDLTESGDPRFLETMMTSKVANSIPVDKVSKYSKDADELLAWFVYDNFNEDKLQIEWVYVDNDFTIHTFEAVTGKDFGRGTFVLEKPDGGWPLGKYEVIISGRGIKDTVKFEIINGSTVSVPIDIAAGTLTLPTLPGWHLTGWEVELAASDMSLRGTPVESRMTGVGGTAGILLDYYTHSGGKNDFGFELKRTNYEGKTLHSGKYNVTWEDPPQYIPDNSKVSIHINRVTEGWGMDNMNVHMPVFGFRFATSDGKTYYKDYAGVIETQNPIPTKNRDGKFKIRVHLGSGYYYDYNYEWKD